MNKLHVTFIGEAGIDTGALSKEFLTGIAMYIVLTVQILNMAKSN